MLPYVDRRGMALALLEEEPKGNPVQDNNFRQFLHRYSSTVADEEMYALVTDSALRLPVNAVNPDALDQLHTKAIAQRQNHVAPLVSSVLRATVGMSGALNDSETASWTRTTKTRPKSWKTSRALEQNKLLVVGTEF